MAAKWKFVKTAGATLVQGPSPDGAEATQEGAGLLHARDQCLLHAKELVPALDRNPNLDRGQCLSRVPLKRPAQEKAALHTTPRIETAALAEVCPKKGTVQPAPTARGLGVFRLDGRNAAIVPISEALQRTTGVPRGSGALPENVAAHAKGVMGTGTEETDRRDADRGAREKRKELLQSTFQINLEKTVLRTEVILFG